MTAVIAHFHHFYWSFQMFFYTVLYVNKYKDIPYLQLAANTNKPLPQHQVCFISLFPLLTLKTAANLSSLDWNYRISEGFGPIRWHSIHWLVFSPHQCKVKERIFELIQLLQWNLLVELFYMVKLVLRTRELVTLYNKVSLLVNALDHVNWQ